MYNEDSTKDAQLIQPHYRLAYEGLPMWKRQVYWMFFTPLSEEGGIMSHTEQYNK